jgi:uncharacterized membrane protein YeaQ/YmgE (transglycosylase-associated protein family)
MGIWAWAMLLLGALALGLIAQAVEQSVSTARTPYVWLVVTIGAIIGGFLGTASFDTWSAWGPVVDGMYILPALIGAVVVGGFAGLMFVRESTRARATA